MWPVVEAKGRGESREYAPVVVADLVDYHIIIVIVMIF